MKKFEDILKDINEMTIDNLPDVSITEEQKNNARRKLFKSIEELKNRNKDLDINVSPTGVLEIVDSLGDRSEDYLNGVKYGRVLREVALKAVHEEVLSEYTNIKGEAFVINANGTTNIGWGSGGALYFKIYLTDNKLITYSFTEFYKIIDKVVVDIKDVIGAGKYKGNIYYIEYGEKEIYIGYTLEETKVAIDNIIRILEQRGVKNNSQSKIVKENTIKTIYILLVIIFMAIYWYFSMI